MDRRTGKLILLGSVSLFLGGIAISPVWADIYRSVDENGVIHFTNVPTQPGYTVYIRERGTDIQKSNVVVYDAYIREASEKHGVELELVKAIIKVESDFNPWAVSRKGAQGLMQIMPENCRRLELKNPFNPKENILAGTQLFRSLLDRFEGNIMMALAAYNAGAEMVDRHRGIPPFQETETYVEKVMHYYRRYREG